MPWWEQEEREEKTINANLFVSSIVVESREYNIRNCWAIRGELAKISIGDFFEIKGVGKLKVIQIVDRDDHAEEIYELIFTCRKVETTTDLVLYNEDSISNRLAGILGREYDRTWR